MIYDVLIIGAGPGGMQAGIAAASEGLKTLVLERDKVGGQIGQTPKLENFVFANGGLTGPQIATMFREQADRMGVEFRKAEAKRLEHTAKLLHVHTTTGIYRSRIVVLAMGNKWNDLNIPGMPEAIKAGLVRVGPVDCLTHAVEGKHVAVFGGGPAAGQAIIELANRAERVTVILRSNYRMPQYLLDRIHSLRNVTTAERRKIVGLDANVAFTRPLTIRLDLEDYITVDVMFACNGLTPATGWLKGTPGIQLDSDGRIITSAPSLLTGMPGVYAIGDCRSGSTPRVGSAIGDGSMVVTEIWRHFAGTQDCHACKQLLGVK